MADDQFVAYCSVAVFRSHKQAAENGNDNADQHYLRKKGIVQYMDEMISFHIHIGADWHIQSKYKHEKCKNQKNFAFFQTY